MNNEAKLTKKVQILEEQYKTINAAYVDTLAELMVSNETITSLKTELDQVTDLLRQSSEE